MTIDGQGSEYFTGIASQADFGSTGKAGSVDINVDGMLQLLNGAQILSDTWATGDAGSMTVHVGEMIIDDQGCEYFTALLPMPFGINGPGRQCRHSCRRDDRSAQWRSNFKQYMGQQAMPGV